jgi:hypothetical protein
MWVRKSMPGPKPCPTQQKPQVYPRSGAPSRSNIN